MKGPCADEQQAVQPSGECMHAVECSSMAAGPPMMKFDLTTIPLKKTSSFVIFALLRARCNLRRHGFMSSCGLHKTKIKYVV